ncbi:HAD family hydrolase [Dactylosporangium sucinum]|uniref:Hydrolase n=1 Tax=Dactylosporangium sucinum TaxID=1424081 RepID=A0A917TXN8_9ACTN|nr:HAD family hydrolase [Dactylosporangium sucinum]GGM43331.1 hypothetical protein GCM10007977_051100 [Dactylosporangium sucinum]
MRSVDWAAPRRNVRAVIFDFFGTLTLVTSPGPGHDLVAAQLRCDPGRLAAELDRTSRERAVGPCRDVYRMLARSAANLGLEPTPEQLGAAAAARLRAVRADIRFRDDAVTVLAALRHRGFATAVLADCAPELPEIFPDLPVAAHVDAALFSAEIGVAQPDPAFYLRASLQLRVRPDECLYVGADAAGGLAGARRVRMQTVRLAAPDLGHCDRPGLDSARQRLEVTELVDVLGLLPAHPGARQPAPGTYNVRRVPRARDHNDRTAARHYSR